MTYDDGLIDKIVSKIKVVYQKITLDDSSVKEFAKDGFRKATKDGFQDDDLIAAAAYWGAHLCFLAQNGNEHVKSESAGPLSHEYFDRSNGKDDFLELYNNLLNDLLSDNGRGVNHGVFY